MAAIPQIEVVGTADDVSAAQGMAVERCPDLVLLDTNLPGEEALSAVRQLRLACPQARCIVLADNVEQQQEAAAAGADVVLLKGFPAAELIATIEELVAQPEARS
jgi:DNA-binding NarL/FixJ family response regulator